MLGRCFSVSNVKVKGMEALHRIVYKHTVTHAHTHAHTHVHTHKHTHTHTMCDTMWYQIGLS